MRWHWQYLFGIFLIIFDVDILIPLFRLLKLSWLIIFFIAWPLAVLGLCVWWWFWREFKNKIFPEMLAVTKQQISDNQIAQEGISLGKKIWNQFNKLIINYFVKIYSNTTNENNRTIKKIKRWGHFSIFIMGISPLPATRTSAAIFCAITKWRSGFVVLLAGDIVHVASVVIGWKMLFRLANHLN